ncbi:hypothetical protein DSO57_1006726 [Entomophthora muscae]|uniref:Uncharacterized protein n=1 Tax=Entomophthora muscae TaxID=34485 RepID=A0ACC2USF7_9FUNG|nr:hypothetical protein DSO57_1006726 [Entomophthora muscae]
MLIQFDCSGDVVNSSGGTKHHHFFSPEQAQPESVTCKTRSQDPCPASALSVNLTPAKIKEANPHGIKALVALYCPPGAPFRTVHFIKYPHNPDYLKYNLKTILIADPLESNKETEYIGHKGKRIKVSSLLFKDKYNYLLVYFVLMTPPLTPQPNHPTEPATAAKTMSTKMFRVLYITLAGLVDSMVPNSKPWSLLGRFLSYIIKLGPILWWALPTGLAVPRPESPNASTYAWLLDIVKQILSLPTSTWSFPTPLCQYDGPFTCQLPH